MESGNKEITAEAIHTRRELIDFLKGKIEITQFDKNPRIKRTNKLEGITEVVFSLDELDNSNNLYNGSPSSTSLTYHVTAHEDSTQFEPCTPHYKKLKKGEFVSLVLRIKYMKNNIMTDGPATTVVLHIR